MTVMTEEAVKTPLAGSDRPAYKVRDLSLAEAGRNAISAAFRKATFHAVPGAGHWLHAEKPDAFHAALTGWLNSLA